MKMLRFCLMISSLCCAAMADGADIYVIARESYNSSPFNRYLFGRFDIDSPDTSGGVGNYLYTFVPIGTASATEWRTWPTTP